LIKLDTKIYGVDEYFIINSIEMTQSVPEENRDLAGGIFCANFAFSRKIAIFRKFCLGAQFLRKFGQIWANLRPCGAQLFAKFANFAICAQFAQIARNFSAFSVQFERKFY